MGAPEPHAGAALAGAAPALLAGAGRPAEFRIPSRRLCPHCKRRDPREMFSPELETGALRQIKGETVTTPGRTARRRPSGRAPVSYHKYHISGANFGSLSPHLICVRLKESLDARHSFVPLRAGRRAHAHRPRPQALHPQRRAAPPARHHPLPALGRLHLRPLHLCRHPPPHLLLLVPEPRLPPLARHRLVGAFAHGWLRVAQYRPLQRHHQVLLLEGPLRPHLRSQGPGLPPAMATDRGQVGQLALRPRPRRAAPARSPRPPPPPPPPSPHDPPPPLYKPPPGNPCRP